jgi:predicted GNAT superfamily acetyltransferase
VRKIDVSLVDYHAKSTAAGIDDLRRALGAPNNPTLFPGHFLKATFPKIGGQIVLLRDSSELAGVGFLFPRELREGRRHVTLRLHRASPAFTALDPDTLSAIERLAGATVVVYDPASELAYHPPVISGDGLDLGRPGAADAGTVRWLQDQIWQPDSPDALYPADLHSHDFRLGTSLIAKVDGLPAGFLFGFGKFGGAALPPAVAKLHSGEFRLESQLMGVVAEHRGRNISAALKLRQADLARQAGIDVINWTFDPLQYVNARLNFDRLGGVAFDFYPNYYAFTNAINVAPASRLSVTWLINSVPAQGMRPSADGSSNDLASAPDILILNRGPNMIASPDGSPRIAIEIPPDWTSLQRDRTQGDLVLRWRATTDAILAEWLGIREGKYVLTGTARDGEKRYLVGNRVDDRLLTDLAERDETSS